MGSVSVGKIYIDKDGAGRLYIPKEVLKIVSFKNKDKVLIIPVNKGVLLKRVEDVSETLLESFVESIGEKNGDHN